MNTIDIQFYNSGFGELIVGSFENTLCLLDWRFRKMRARIDQRIPKGLGAEYKEQSSDIIRNAISQLDAYTLGERKKFEIPLTLVGTPFQKSVWTELQKIAFGETITYLQLAENVVNARIEDVEPVKKSLPTRAVAAANGANAISIIVPCHRVIGSNGQLVGYAGGLPAKKKLLKNENIVELQMDLFS